MENLFLKHCLKLIVPIVLSVSGLFRVDEVYAQQSGVHTVSGVVTDFETGIPLPGVNIMVKGTAIGTITMNDGTYSLSVSDDSILVFSFIGYKTYEFRAARNNPVINLQMEEAAESLDEVVVIGYGSALKKEITGSISTIKEKDFNQGAYSDALGLIQGKVAGLIIVKPDGADPMSGYSILLRGTNTLTSGQGPLIVIDGVAGADLKNINFEDVQSVDILKDGAAAAIYGTRGTNGVILITTKGAQPGTKSFEYSSRLSVQVAPRSVQTLSADEFEYAIENYAPEKSESIYDGDTDWFSEITRALPFSQKHSLALAGGSESFSYRTSFNIDKNNGLLKDNKSDRYLFKTNIRQTTLDEHLDLDYNLTLGMRHYNPANYDLFYQSFIQNPTQPVYDPTNTEYGGYSRLTGIEYYNPVAMLNERTRNGSTYDFAPNVRATLHLIQGLDFVNFLSFEGSSWEENSYKTRYYPAMIGSDGEAEISNGRSYTMQYETMVNYVKTIGDHRFQALAGYSYQEMGYNSSYIINAGYDTDLYGVNNIGAGSSLQDGTAEMGSSKESSKLIAFFGRVIYNYNDKYLATVSLRREGSSRFGINHKWGSFPAISLGWRMDREEFMQNVNWINNLKLRVGFGVTGNQDFDSYKSLILMGKAGKFYYNGEWINSYQPVSNPNPDLRWEKKQELNAGIDFSLFENRLGGAFDYYYRQSTDLLYTYSVSVPPYIYDELFTNVGTISNTGVELTLNALLVKSGDMEWNIIFTFSKNINELVKFSNEEFTNTYVEIGWIGGAIPQYSQRIEEGKSLGTFYGPVWLGLDEYGYDKFKNQNPIGAVNPDKYEDIGNANPFANIGWGNNLKYRNWNLNVSFRMQIGGKVLNLYRAYYENWQTIGSRNIVHTQLETPEFIGNATYSSKYVEDASYLKLDNASLSYDLGLKSKYISGLQFSLSVQDVFCLTRYKGLDPEVNLGSLEPGIERLSYYPRTTAITLGVNAKF
ncbi:MAG: SusC/RagA family TonB-linked outer membrane protein [Bacteroidales bacterium]|nr:SusC/RagA family TonB-linked outer membrane protein [Bacteroidales bacterium]MBN2698846.1 SusC/RagA family TonB-linked outer membrane protein [Bacteroidales bacterium]